MTVPNIGDVIELSLEGDHDLVSEVNNVFQFKYTSGSIGNITTYVDNLRELAQAIADIFKGYNTLLTVYRRFRARNVTQATAQVTGYLTANVPGTVAGDAAPAGCAALMTFRTAQKNVVLRKFIGPIADGLLQSDGLFSPGTVSVGTSDLATFLATMTTTNATWDYGHYHVPTATFLIPISGYFSTIPSYQRRRKPLVGS